MRHGKYFLARDFLQDICLAGPRDCKGQEAKNGEEDVPDVVRLLEEIRRRRKRGLSRRSLIHRFFHKHRYEFFYRFFSREIELTSKFMFFQLTLHSTRRGGDMKKMKKFREITL